MGETKAEVKAQAKEAPAEVKAEVTEPVPLGGQQNFTTVTPDEAAEHRQSVRPAHIAHLDSLIDLTNKIEDDVKDSMAKSAMTLRNRMQSIRRDAQDLLRSDPAFKRPAD